MIEMRDARPEDAEAIRFRAVDWRECWGFALSGPRAAAQRAGRAWTVTMDGRPVAMFGCERHPILSVGRPWMLGSEELDDVPLLAWRRSRAVVAMMRRDVDLLENYIAPENERSIAWLARLGFSIDPPRPVGALMRPGRRFWMRGDACARLH